MPWAWVVDGACRVGGPGCHGMPGEREMCMARPHGAVLFGLPLGLGGYPALKRRGRYRPGDPSGVPPGLRGVRGR